jgi:integrase
MPTQRAPLRIRIGRVSYYRHHGAWYIYYRDGTRVIRRRAPGGQAQAECEASLLNARLVAGEAGIELPPSQPPCPEGPIGSPPDLTVADLRAQFLHHHEHVLCSSIATVSRYTAATRHLEQFAKTQQILHVSEIKVPAFVQYLRTVEVPPAEDGPLILSEADVIDELHRRRTVLPAAGQAISHNQVRDN